MRDKELSHAKVFRRAGAGLALVLGFAAFLLLPVVALADSSSPHIVPTLDTSVCAACHATHAGGPVLLRVLSGTPAASDACIGCHGGGAPDAVNIMNGPVDSFTLPSGHVSAAGVSPAPRAAVTGCDSCHDPHGASSRTRNIPEETINGSQVSSAGKDLCLACHDEDNSWFGPNYPSTFQPTRDATGFPVSGTWPGPSAYTSPSNPHDQIPETTQTVGLSDPVTREKGDCLYCHAAHGGPNTYDGLVATYTVPAASTLASDQAEGTYATLCFECHSSERESGMTTSAVDIKAFVTASGLGGHSIVTGGGTLPVGAPVPCFECHNPHGSKRDNAALISDERGRALDTATADGTRQFCFTCHTTSDTDAGWNSVDSTYTPVTTTDTVVGLPRYGAELRLMLHDGHSQDSTESCGDCHGNSYVTGGHNVHNPTDGSADSTLTPSEPTTQSVAASGTPLLQGLIDAAGGNASDTVPPLTASDATSTYETSATITLTAVDNAGGTGVAATYWTLDGGAISTGTVVTTSVLGPHTLSYWSVDNAGNTETTSTVTFTVVEAVPPPASDTTLTPPPASDTTSTPPPPSQTPTPDPAPSPDPTATAAPATVVMQIWDFISGAPNA